LKPFSDQLERHSQSTLLLVAFTLKSFLLLESPCFVYRQSEIDNILDFRVGIRDILANIHPFHFSRRVGVLDDSRTHHVSSASRFSSP